MALNPLLFGRRHEQTMRHETTMYHVHLSCEGMLKMRASFSTTYSYIQQMHAFPCVHFDPCDGKKRAVSVLTPSPSKHLVASTENLIFLNADFTQSMFAKHSKARISQETCRTFSIVMVMTLHGHVQSVWSTSTCQEARALGQRL